MQILVIILACALAVLLVLAIVMTVLVIRLLQAVGRITDKAEHVIQTAENVGAAFSEATGKLAVVRLISNIVTMATKRSKRRPEHHNHED